MNIYVSERLKEFRRRKKKTQEELANHLGISVQAVSKWERGESYPDITLLPSIASYYGVSIDELFGVSKIENEKRIEEYHIKDQRLHREGKNADRVTLWREAIRDFPNEMSVISGLMFALRSTDRKKYADEIIELGERIIKESTDNVLRSGAIQTLCFVYYVKGDINNARKYANMASLYYVTVNELTAFILEGEEAV